VGVLVQSNYGGILQIQGAPVGRELGQYAFKRNVEGGQSGGSIMMVVATDAPIDDRSLRRLASRALLGLARTGSYMGNGSGDYVLAFATHPAVRRRMGSLAPRDTMATARRELTNDEMSALFEGALEATEEAIYNSMFRATTVTSRWGTVEALPIDRVRAVLEKHGIRR
jgi:D-aminopeptidase